MPSGSCVRRWTTLPRIRGLSKRCRAGGMGSSGQSEFPANPAPAGRACGRTGLRARVGACGRGDVRCCGRASFQARVGARGRQDLHTRRAAQGDRADGGSGSGPRGDRNHGLDPPGPDIDCHRAADCRRRVAVRQVGAGADIDYLRIGLADEVADVLSYAPSLAVRPIAASRRYAGAGWSAQQAGRELRAASIVTGHFTRHASELRVTLEAIDVDADRLLWRDTIAAPGDDVIALREQLTSRIREGLLPALKAGAPIAAPNRPQSAEAYGLSLRSLSMSPIRRPTDGDRPARARDIARPESAPMAGPGWGSATM